MERYYFYETRTKGDGMVAEAIPLIEINRYLANIAVGNTISTNDAKFKIIEVELVFDKKCNFTVYRHTNVFVVEI